MRNEAFGRQAAFDEMRRRRRLDRRVLAAPAAIFRSPGADHLEAGGLIVEPFGDVLADLVQGAAAGRTGLVVRLQNPFFTRQLRRQGAEIAPALFLLRLFRRAPFASLDLPKQRGSRLFDVFKTQH